MTATLEPEDEMRADLYALLARLFYAPPDDAILRMIVAAPEIGTEADDEAFAAAWAALVEAAKATDAASLGPAYDELLVGTGAPAVSPYFSTYLAATGREKLLVRLRDDLRRLGLARAEWAGEPEDHIAGLCDGMRHLVAAGSGTLALARQRDFFERYVGPGYPAFCAALAAANAPAFYRALARLTRAFLDVEADALAME